MVTYPQQYPYYQNYPAYQQQYQQPIQVQQQLPPQNTNNQILAWVRSEDEGVNYPLSAGQSIFLMNQSEPYLYMKSVDQLGKTTFLKKRLIDESDNQDSKVNLTEYIRREELEDLISDKIQREFEKKMSEISFKPTKARKQVIIDED